MVFKSAARHLLQAGMAAFANRTFFSKWSRVRAVGFEVLSRHQPLIACTSTGGERFVVKGGDQYIGRGVFAEGGYDFGKFEKALGLIAKRGREPTVLIDVGANIGTICIPAVARGLVERAVAIEAEPDNARLLRANIALNGLEERIVAINAAAGPEDGKTLVLELARDNFGDHRIRVSDEPGGYGESDRDLISLSSSTLDTLVSDPPAGKMLIWIDVQGFEGFALSGARSILASKPPLVLEFSPYHIDRAKSFAALCEAIGPYSEFIDLNAGGSSRPLSALPALHRELAADSTDILVL
jgi:FkbM family methyltransferase